MRDLFLSSGTGHSMMVLAFVIGIGLLLGKIKYKGITLGSVWILLTGLLFGAVGIKAEPLFLHFLKEFGLVLFVFSVGLQVGPGFFHSFRGNGLRLNLLALLLILLAVGCTLALYAAGRDTLPAMVGVMSGSLTNTPGLGTAQQTYYDIAHGTFLAEVERPAVSSLIAGAFAVAYPVGILVLTLLILALRRICKSDLQPNGAEDENALDKACEMTVQVENPAIFGRTLNEVSEKFPGHFVTATLIRGGRVLNPADNPVLEKDDRLELEVQQKEKRMVRILFGSEIDAAQNRPALSGEMVSRRLTVTKSSMTGKRLADLDILGKYGVTVTLIYRSGIRLVARPELYLQMGDTIQVIGEEKTIAKVADLVGNSSSGLDKPNLVPIFIGIGLGLILGSLPLRFPGMTHAIRLGLAGGPLLVAILLGHFGPKRKITTYTTASANRMLREIGLALMLATIGLSAGSTFVHDFNPVWIGYAALIVLVPSLITALIGRRVCKLSCSQLSGLLAGATTNAPVLQFIRESEGSDKATVSYATVYPFALFLQVLVAQILTMLSFVI